MSRRAKIRPRSYSSAVRDQQARETRDRVISVALQLFLAQGFARTTVNAVAHAATVSPELIYTTLGGKRGLLEAVIDVTIMGPGAPIPLEEQLDWDRIGQLPSARERLRAYVEFSCGVLERTSPVHAMIRGAADGEPFADELSARLLAERLASNTKHIRDYVGDALRDGLTLRRAAERYCTLTSPEMHHLSTVKLGWSHRAFRDWIADVVEQELLEST